MVIQNCPSIFLCDPSHFSFGYCGYLPMLGQLFTKGKTMFRFFTCHMWQNINLFHLLIWLAILNKILNMCVFPVFKRACTVLYWLADGTSLCFTNEIHKNWPIQYCNNVQCIMQLHIIKLKVCDTWWGVNILSKCQLLRFGKESVLKIGRKRIAESINESIN